MNIAAISAQPYVYNVNAISSSSLNRVSGITDNVLSGKIDYSGLTGENENELPVGQSKNFADIIMRQMSMSAANASRVMQPAEEVLEEAQENMAELVIDEMNQMQNNSEPSLFQRRSAAGAYEMNLVG